MNFWSQRINPNTPSLVFPPGAQLPSCHLECTWANSEPDTGHCPHDLCQLISQNISRSGESTPYFGYMLRTASALHSGRRAYSDARARINIWLTYGHWIFSSHSLGSCRGGVFGWNIWSVHLNQIIIKIPVRKTMCNYFSYLGYSLKYMLDIIRTSYQFHFWKV